MHKSEKSKWSRSVMSDPQRPHGLQPTRLLHPWDFPGKSTGVGCHCLHRLYWLVCCIFQIPLINYMTLYLSFPVWLISRSVMPSKFIHVAKFHFFLWLNSILYPYIFFIHSSAYRHLGCFYILAILNKAPVNTEVHISFQINVLFFLVYTWEWNSWVIQ